MTQTHLAILSFILVLVLAAVLLPRPNRDPFETNVKYVYKMTRWCVWWFVLACLVGLGVYAR